MSADDQPRFLTEDEVTQILSRIPPPQITISELRNHVHQEILTMYKYQLGIERLRPSKIEKMGDYLSNKIARSYYQAGFPVGFNVSESVSQPATQLVLNTFHSAGQSGQNGFDRFKKNAFFSSYKKKQHRFNMKIHMKNKDIPYEELYLKAQSFVSVNIYDLLDHSLMIPETYPFEDMSPYTKDFQDLIHYEDHGYALRLKFDTGKLFLNQILLEEIAFALEDMKDCPFTAFYGPQLFGIIDLYIKPSSISQNMDSDLEEAIKIFRYGRLETYMKEHFLGQYKPITSARVEKMAVLSLISNVVPDYNLKPEGDEVSKENVQVWIDWVAQRKNGIPIEKLENFLSLSGYEIVGIDPYGSVGGNYLVVKAPGDGLKLKNNLEKILKEEDEKMQKSYDETGVLRSSELYCAGYYNTIATTGSDLQNVRLNPDVDEYYTISDSPMEIYDVLGLEVLRGYLEKEIFDLFADNGENIAPKNISIMVDWMTANATPSSLHSSSVKRSYNSFIRAMCFEDPKTAIVKGALLASEEPLSNTSARILFGARQKLGTGAFTIERDEEISQKYRDLSSSGEMGAFRLTKQTLDLTSPGSLPVSRTRLPAPASDLFTKSTSSNSVDEDRLSVQDELDFGA
jgi:hypothetical protein